METFLLVCLHFFSQNSNFRRLRRLTGVQNWFRGRPHYSLQKTHFVFCRLIFLINTHSWHLLNQWERLSISHKTRFRLLRERNHMFFKLAIFHVWEFEDNWANSPSVFDINHYQIRATERDEVYNYCSVIKFKTLYYEDTTYDLISWQILQKYWFLKSEIFSISCITLKK